MLAAAAASCNSAARHRVSRPRAILFDWDNTLVDSWTTIHEALNTVMAAMEKPLWSLGETKERVRLSLRESFPRHFGERWEEARQLYLDTFGADPSRAIDRSARPRRIAPRARRRRDLSRRGQQQDRLSLATRDGSHRVVCAVRQRRRGRRCVGGQARRRPGLTRIGIRAASSPGETVWLVGDTGVDMECACNSGCVPVLLGSGIVRGGVYRVSAALGLFRLPHPVSLCPGLVIYRRAPIFQSETRQSRPSIYV